MSNGVAPHIYFYSALGLGTFGGGIPLPLYSLRVTIYASLLANAQEAIDYSTVCHDVMTYV